MITHHRLENPVLIFTHGDDRIRLVHDEFLKLGRLARENRFLDDHCGGIFLPQILVKDAQASKDENSVVTFVKFIL